jgi:chromosomal replication initiation ATPase DnaA
MMHVHTLLKKLSGHFDVPVNVVLGDSRRSDVVRVRHIALFMLVHRYGYTHARAGAGLRRSTSNVTHSINRLRARITVSRLERSLYVAAVKAVVEDELYSVSEKKY